MQRRATDRTRGSLLRARSAPALARTLLRRILDQLGLQSTHPQVDFILNFPQGRFWMASPPLTDLSKKCVHSVLANALQVSDPCSASTWLIVPSYPFLFDLSTPFAKK